MFDVYDYVFMFLKTSKYKVIQDTHKYATYMHTGSTGLENARGVHED